MKRQQLFSVAAAVVLLAVVVFGYRYFLKDRLQTYAANEARKAQLTSKLEELEATYSIATPETTAKGISPETLTQAYREAIQPWADAVVQRAEYFDMGPLTKFDPVPEEGLAKFDYETRFYKMLQDLQGEAYRKGVLIPTTTFGAPPPDSLVNQGVSQQQANQWLKQLALGVGITRMLMQQGLNPIRDIQLWPPSGRGEVQFQTVGIAFAANLDTVSKLLNFFRTQDKYFSVNAIKITNQNMYYPDPQLEVSLLFTMGQYSGEPVGLARLDAEDQAAAAQNSAQAAVQSFSLADIRRQRLEAKQGGKAKPVEKAPWWKSLWPF